LVDAGVKRVLIGAYDTDPRVAGGGMKTLLDRGIEVVCGCKEKEATEMNRAFFDRIEKERLEKEAQTRQNKT
jgi:diaminohydroxyphosphoribosylaminopyrimidine deaminase/5-amino-6-(5-phosphoribosylamino)uracil reductase